MKIMACVFVLMAAVGQPSTRHRYEVTIVTADDFHSSHYEGVVKSDVHKTLESLLVA